MITCYNIFCTLRCGADEKHCSGQWNPGDRFIVEIAGRNVTLETTMGWRWNKDGEKIPAPGRIIVAETGQTVGNGDRHLPIDRDETTIDLRPPLDGIRLRMALERVPEKRRTSGPPGKKCDQCRWFDRREGHRVLTTETHRGFQGGQGYVFTDVVARSLADEVRGLYLHPDETGYCPKTRELLHYTAEACEIFEPLATGFWRRLWSRLTGRKA